MADASFEKLKVFISYSRKDSAEFADELIAGLELAGFAPFLDRRDIAAGEEWQSRLDGLIAQSDTVVYVISPEAVRSERCGWEVDRTFALSKRLLPVIFKPVPEADLPEQLCKLQFIRFDAGPGITRALAQLAAALRQDFDWIREHTRLGEIAARWQARGQPEALLLRGDELEGARAWAGNRKATAPETTEAQRALLSASGVAEGKRLSKERAQLDEMRHALEATARSQKRLRQYLALVIVLLLGIIIGLVGWINQSYIKEQMNWYSIVRPYRVANFDAYVLKPDMERTLKPLASFRECARDCPEMIVIPAGNFMMGSPASEKGRNTREGPQHRVAIGKSFAVSRFDVTFADWDACVSVGGCPRENRAGDAGFGRGTRPVIYVSWDDSQAYVAWLSKMTGQRYRLLTEAEWEYAARAGTSTAYFWGEEIGVGNANCDGCGSEWDDRQTSPVGSFKPNAFGLHDMAGNVWQWVQDCYQPDYNGASTEGSAVTSVDCKNRVVRGGSWYIRPPALRSAYRSWVAIDDRTPVMGFRVARTLNP